jgi:hypothetical protein
LCWRALAWLQTLCANPCCRCHANGDKPGGLAFSVDNHRVVPKLSPVLCSAPAVAQFFGQTGDELTAAGCCGPFVGAELVDATACAGDSLCAGSRQTALVYGLSLVDKKASKASAESARSYFLIAKRRRFSHPAAPVVHNPAAHVWQKRMPQRLQALGPALRCFAAGKG